MPSEPARRLDAAVVAPVTLAWLAFWWPQLAGERVLFIRDLTLFAAPAKQYWLQRLGAGELPAWTTQVSGGLPFLADPANQALYPMNLLMLTSGDLMVALSRFVLAHLLVGMLGAAGVVRVLGGSRLAALLAAGLFGFSGYAISITDNITYVAGVAWVPVVLAGWLHARRCGGGGGLVVAALAIVAAVLAGDVLAAAVACGAMLLLAVFDSVDGAHSLPRGLASLALVVALALLLSAVQILPTSAMFADSARDVGLHVAQQTEWSFPVERTLEFVQPYFFGSTYPVLGFFSPDLYPAMRAPWVQSVYLGLLPVVLAVAGALAAPRRSAPWLLLGLLSLLLAYGDNAPWYGWLAEAMPLTTTQRYPEKLVVWTTLGVVLLAARGLDALRDAAGPFARLATASAFTRTSLCLALLATQFFLLLDWPARALVWSHAQESSAFWSRLIGAETTHLQGLLWHSLPVAAVLVGLLLVPARAYKAVAVLLVVGAVTDLVLVHRDSVPVVPVGLASADTPVALAMMRAAGGEGARIYFDDEAPGKDVRFEDGRLAAQVLAGLGEGRDVYARGYLAIYAMLFAQHRLSTQTGTRHGVAYINGRFSPLQPASHLGLEQALLDGGADRLLAATGTAFVITSLEPHNRAFDVAGISEVARDGELNLRLLAVHQPQRFARIASTVREIVVGDSYDTLVDLHGRDVDAALIESQGATAERFQASSGARVTAWRRPSPERIELDVEGVDGTTLLVITESWAPGWRAMVDSEQTTVERADLRLLGVTVPAGGRRVTLDYRTPRLAAGVALSVAGLLFGAVVLLRAGRR